MILIIFSIIGGLFIGTHGGKMGWPISKTILVSLIFSTSLVILQLLLLKPN